MLRRSVIVTLAALAFACSSGTSATDGGAEGAAPRPTCVEIIGQCHLADTGSGPAHDCHEGAHEAWSEDDCKANRAMCTAACTASDAGADGATDAAHDAEGDAHDHDH